MVVLFVYHEIRIVGDFRLLSHEFGNSLETRVLIQVILEPIFG